MKVKWVRNIINSTSMDLQDELQGMDRKKLMTMPLEELDRLIEREKMIISEKEEEAKKIKETRKIEFFKPIEPYQTKILELLHAGKKIITLQGANSIGKTVLGVNIIGSACLGIQPWDKKDTIWGRKPVKCRILCSDWEKHAKDVIVPKLKEWLPLEEYTTSKNNLSIESSWEFKNKSTIEIVTGKQDTKDLEGWDGDIVWADEPFQRDKFVTLLRGLRKAKENLEDDDPEMGIFLITMTAVKEAWMLDDIIRNTHKNYASVTEIPMNMNPYLSKDYQETYEASLKENEKIPRIMGGWINLIGLVWPGFKPEIHLIDDFQVPTDWPVVPMIDWHTNKPIAVSFYAFDLRDMIYLVDEIYRQGSAEEIGDEIIRRKKLNPWRIEDAFIDPLSKGDTAYVKNMGIDYPTDTFNRMKEKLWKEGIELKVATKDKDSGIRNVEDRLKGLNGIPSLFFFRSLTNKIKDEGTIWEIQRWIYDENGKPKDENDHFMENLYRVTLTGIKYAKMRSKDEPFKSEINFDVFAPNYGIKETETEFNIWP